MFRARAYIPPADIMELDSDTEEKDHIATPAWSDFEDVPESQNYSHNMKLELYLLENAKK